MHDYDKINLELENQVVLLLSKRYLNTIEVSYLYELLCTDMDWSKVIGQIELHRVGGIAWKVLNEYIFTHNNKNSFKCARLIRYVRNVYKINLISSQEQLHITSFICESFDNVGIKYILLKGLSVAQDIYKDLGLRSFNDNDILVHPNHLNQAISILKSQGYTQGKLHQQREIIPYSRTETIKHSLVSHEVVPFIKNIDDPMFLHHHVIDLHFSVNLMSKQRNIELVKEILNVRVSNTLNSKKLYGLTTEYMLWFLCQHLFKEAVSHRDMQLYKDLLLYKFCDIYILLKNADLKIDWIWFIKLVKSLEQEKDAYYALYQTSKIFGEEICPNYYLSQIEPSDKNYLNEIYKYDSNEVIYRYEDEILNRIFDLNRPSKIIL